MMIINRFPVYSMQASHRSLVRGLNSLVMTPEEDAKVALNWHYPSDHLPVSGDVLGLVDVGSWNILNGAYVSHMERDAWQDSYLIQQEKNRSSRHPTLSKREEECYQSIEALLTGPDSLDVLCLQECSGKMFRFLQEAFSSGKIQLFMTDGGMDNHVVTCVKTSSSLRVTSAFSKILWNRAFVRASTKTKENPQGIQEFGPDQWRPAECVKILKRTPGGKEESVTVVNVHISSAGKSDAYKMERGTEVWEGLQDLISHKDTLVCAGDYNMSRELVDKTGLRFFQNLTDYHGHVDAKEPKIYAIDHLLVGSSSELQTYSGSISVEEIADPRVTDVYNRAIRPMLKN